MNRRQQAYEAVEKALLPVVYAGPATAVLPDAVKMATFVTLDVVESPLMAELGPLMQREGVEQLAGRIIPYNADGGGIVLWMAFTAPVVGHFAVDIMWEEWPDFFHSIVKTKGMYILPQDKGPSSAADYITIDGAEMELSDIEPPLDEVVARWQSAEVK